MQVWSRYSGHSKNTTLFGEVKVFQRTNILTEARKLIILSICKGWCAFQVEGIECAGPRSTECQQSVGKGFEKFNIHREFGGKSNKNKTGGED